MLGLIAGLAAASGVPEWTLISRDKKGSFYARSEDIVIGEHHGQRDVQLWTKSVKPDHSYSVVLDLVDCPESSYRTVQVVEYTPSGTVRRFWKRDGQREYAVPDSKIAFVIDAMLCAYMDPPPAVATHK
jgi:hypothetical protein